MMSFRKIYLAILILILLTGGSACRKQATITQTSAPGANPSSPEQYHQAEGAALAIPQTKFFKGSIGSRLGLQMKLTRDGENVTGNYSYQKVGAKIELKGTIDKDNNLTLEEFDNGGKQTGFFKGSWLVDKEDGMVKVAGNWSKPNSEKKTAFSLHEEPIEFTGSVELIAKRSKESNKKLNYEIEAEYPQVTGALDNRFDKFNREAKNLVTSRIAAFKKETTEVAKDDGATPDAGSEDTSSSPANSLDISYNIALAKDDLISIEFEVGSYSSGAAHPNSYSEVLNYDVKAGKALRLSDLFNPGAKYLQVISAYCIKDLKRQAKSKDSLLDDQTIQNGAGLDPQNYDSWTITKKGLEITFDPYQVASYAAGPQRVVVPYSALKELIRPEGLLTALAK